MEVLPPSPERAQSSGEVMPSHAARKLWTSLEPVEQPLYNLSSRSTARARCQIELIKPSGFWRLGWFYCFCLHR